jgi:Asp-tRNA(Asn)/Glu-tRNA(Gln) amidotransferase A subunit family amidase
MSSQTIEFSITAAERLNETLNAFLEIDREGALQRATEIEKRGTASVLAGIPIAVKDNI